MQIQILNTSVETKPTAKGSYQQLEVAYKNLTFQGKVEAKKLMSFGANAEAFKALATAVVGTVWEVDSVKNEKGYLDWIKVTKSDIGASSTPVSSTSMTGLNNPSLKATSAPKSTYETPEERAKKQIYIVRQSSISNAIDFLSVGAKSQPKLESVIETARAFEEFVFNTGSVAAVVAKDSGSIEDLESDVPY